MEKFQVKQMNIFHLDRDLNKAVSYYVDKHVVKIRTEIAQMLSLAFKRGAYYNHPMSRWVRDTQENYMWAGEYGIKLCEEKDWRYGKKPQKTLTKLQSLIELKPDCENLGLEFPQCMPAQYHSDDPVEAYRAYYIGEKHSDKNGNPMTFWTNRERPDWYVH